MQPFHVPRKVKGHQIDLPGYGNLLYNLNYSWSFW